MSTITITRAERNLIQEHVLYWLPIGDPISFENREDVTENLRKLQRGIEFYDELGWDTADPRQTFSLTVDAALLELLREGEQFARNEIERQIDYHETHILGLRPTRHGKTWSDDYATIEDANAAVDRDVSANERDLRICTALLARLDAAAVTA